MMNGLRQCCQQIGNSADVLCVAREEVASLAVEDADNN